MTYASRYTLNTVFGRANIDKWADLDNDGDEDKIEARILAVLDQADEEVNDRLRRGPYTVPFTSPSAKIVRVATLFAGVFLYEARGVQDFDQETHKAVHRLAYQKTEAETTCRKILSGQFVLSVIPAVVTYPRVVADDDPAT